jgi:dolichyl-phosphate beta-glucosyltransferase
LIDYIAVRKLDAETIIVDDGSNDEGKTKQVALKYACKYISYAKNKGKGGAIRYGMQNSSGDIKIFTDADIPFESEAFDAIINELTTKNYEIVLGDRTLNESNYFGEISNNRKFGSNLFTFLVKSIINIGVFDTQCGLKGFKKQVANDIFSVTQINSFAFDVEVIFIALKRKYSIKKIAVCLRSKEGNSVSLLKHAPKMLADLFKIKLNYAQGKYKIKH